MAADTGSLNRLPKICGNDSWIREIALTARRFDETEALQHGRFPDSINHSLIKSFQISSQKFMTHVKI